jgi:3-(3-hydroxy-phenyl)propionate hydroxylase
MIRLALGVGWAMTGGGRVGDAARRLVLPRLRFIPGMRRRIVDSTTPALHSTALAGKSHLPRRLGGRLCPNPLLRDGRRLDDVLGAGFALITMVRPTAADEAALRRRGVVVLIPQPGDVLATWLRRGHANAAVVRPDRTVARAGRDVAALCAWTTGVLREG